MTTLAELVASGRATCNLEEVVRTRAGEPAILMIGRCSAYELAGRSELPFVIRCGRRYVVSVPALLRYLDVPLPAEWTPAGSASEAEHECCHEAGCR